MHLVTFERRSDAESADRGAPAPGARSMGNASLGFDTLESSRPGARRLGALLTLGPHAGAVVDLNRALAIKLAYDDVGAPEAEADSLLPAGTAAFLRRLPGSLHAARTALEFAVDALNRYDAPDVLRAGAVEARRRVRLCAPVPRPGKILAVERNYPGHGGARGGGEPLRRPALSLEAPSAVIGPEDEIALPACSSRVDCGGALAAVIGRPARMVDAEDALEHVVGYCVANDVSARDFESLRGQRSIGASCDTFTPLGPALVTADEIPDPQSLAIRTAVSGEMVQSSNTKEMIFPIAEIIAFASALMTLEPGDVLLTGTPPGVGAKRRPQRWLRDGDLVEVEVERVGRLHNYVRSERGGGAEDLPV